MTGLSLHYAYRLPALARALSEQLKPRLQSTESLFSPLDIIVPSLTMQAYLEQEIARQLGVTPNLRFHLLRGYLADKLSPATGGPATPKPRILSAEQLQQILIKVLQDAYFNGESNAASLPKCDALRAYLHVTTGSDAKPNEAARELRLYQITGELARLFVEYSFSRSAPVFGPPMEPAPLLVTWSKRADLESDNPIEVWQHALWTHVFGKGGVISQLNARGAANHEAPYMTLPEAFEAFGAAQISADKAMPKTVYMVGFPYIARVFVEATQLLAQHSDVHVFALTPAQKWAKGSDAELGDDDHPLLRQWASAGGIHAKMWAATSAEITRSEAASEAPDNLLGALQSDIIASADAPAKQADAAQGIRFVECPSIAREVESVANEIWTLLRDDEDLRPDEIAVLIAGSDQESYQVQLGEAFRSFHRLPFNEVGLPATTGGRLLDAAKLLLELPFSRFRRSELLKLLVHPNLRGRSDEVDIDQWAQWCDQLGILYAASREEQADSYLSDESEHRWDLYNWDQGFRRVVLGNFLRGERSGSDKLFEMGRSQYQPLEISDAASPATSNFVALASSIMADARWLRGPDDAPTKRNAKEWATIVEDYLRTYLQVSTQDEEDAADRRKEDRRNLSAACRAIRSIGANCPIDGEISYRIFNEFARDAVENLRQSGSHYLCGGVIVSTLLEARAIPFKHVFVVGLGEGQFPNPEILDPLDLRLADPQLGDLKPSDRDRYAFLETLLAARQGVTLSWVAREATTGEPLNASSVVNELRWVLQGRFGHSSEALTTIQPLRRYDASLFADDSNLHPIAFKEREIMALRETLTTTENAQKPPTLPTLDELRRDDSPLKLTPTMRKKLKLAALPSEIAKKNSASAPAQPTEKETTKEPRRVRISLSNLRKFLESPLQAAASVQLGLREDEDDIFAAEREPLEANRLYRAIALKRVVTKALATGTDADKLEETYTQTLLPKMPLRAQLPSGHFLSSNRDAHLELLNAWWRNFDVLELKAPLSPIGIGVDSDECAEKYDAIHLDLDLERDGVPEIVHVEITGRTELSSESGDLYLTFDTGTGTYPRGKYIARSFMSWAVATAAGRVHPSATRLMVNNSHKLSEKTAPRFSKKAPNWSKEDAREYLKELVTSLLCECHDYLLPIEFAAEKPNMKPADCTREHLQDWLEKALSSERTSIASKYGPIKDYARFEAPRDGQIAARLDARFPFFAWSEK
ncbi:exodeoxyribonuclease V subunit gamma [Bradymonas sediminis]|uniref:RecC C-terminal domain-containing protein n=1 Tax=Bradymonas sediminis TaxID=1548548 RepID=A0A2Z4FHT8_9DELT|nr:exodeoxyribonuclease V subunit gamma [Bradymonas sediminis]AWV88479.1 hypothetical protein DN745_03600 [Bradymonas sediminis]TDP77609.1 DNA helicase/exodeoxyribonuclease V gamma subunit [Bradymonas sediminis]